MSFKRLHHYWLARCTKLGILNRYGTFCFVLVVNAGGHFRVQVQVTSELLRCNTQPEQPRSKRVVINSQNLYSGFRHQLTARKNNDVTWLATSLPFDRRSYASLSAPCILSFGRVLKLRAAPLQWMSLTTCFQRWVLGKSQSTFKPSISDFAANSMYSCQYTY